jgi:ribosome biogenesis GTPase
LTSGTIIKGVGGFYEVKTEKGIYACKGRGLFRKDQNILYVGDEVMITENESGIGIITEILPRKNKFIRPPVANVEQMVIIMSLAKPEPNYVILDKFLVMSEKNQVNSIVGFNKIDLATPAVRDYAEEIYSSLYPTVFLSGKTGEGLEDLKRLLKDKKNAFAGPSGGGKSTLLNKIQASLELETGKISRKTSRGKHTTRHVELYAMDFGGMIFDTPGFTSFDVLEVELEELQLMYPEFAPYIGKCRFTSCRHINEPDCAIKSALTENHIHPSRYQSFQNQYAEIQEKKRY